MERKQRNRRPGKESACPKYVICSCPESHVHDAERYRSINANYTIEKLRELVSDPVTHDHVSRMSQLLCDYLIVIGDGGYVSFDSRERLYAQPMKHLPSVMRVLEFLAWRSREVADYRIHLEQMLWLCGRPPLLERTSDSLISSVIMEQYFTLLGYLLTISRNEEEVQRMCDILDCLLVERKKLANVAAVKLDFRRRSMENSMLPIIAVELLEAASPRVYPKILELTFLLASVSCQSGCRMLEAGVLNTLLTRMDLPYATQLRCVRPPDEPLEGEEYSWDTMLLITSLLWSLVNAALSSGEPSERLRSLLSLQQCAMWGLRYSFKRQILRGQHLVVNLKIRNDIAALILAGVASLPTWNLVSSGIAEDIVGLLDAVESGIVTIWTESVKFSDTEEDLFFKRALLTILAYLADVDACIFVMKNAVMPVILRIVKFCADDKRMKGSSSCSILLEHAMHLLSLLAPQMATEFVKCRGTFVLLTIVDRVFSAEFSEHLVMIFTRTVCSIVLRDDALLLEDFRAHKTIPLLIRLIGIIVDFDKLTTRRQRILTLLLAALEGLVKKQTSVQQMYGQQSIKLILKIFTKCLYQKNEDFQVDQRLLLATGCFVWECVARCRANLQIFLNCGGLYAMLDVIEAASHPTRCLYLGALADMCDYIFCGPCLCTWRGSDKKTGLMSLLAAAWRQEEDRLGIKRRADGSIADPELPQMGTKQWMDTYRSKLTADASPTVVDMFGSVRSKIFSIVKIIEKDGDKYEAAKSHYKILLDGLPIEDRITLCCVDLYLRLKLGQMWTELGRYLEHAGITPLSVDAQLIAHMMQWHRSWGIIIEERQRKLASAARRVEEVLEQDELARIRESKLAPTLEALDQVDRIRRTTDRSYMLQKKDRQRRQANAALSFPAEADAARCHRTFAEKTNVTAIFGQRQSIRSSHSRGSDYMVTELPPVSPPDLSFHEETFSSLDGASDDSLSYERHFTAEYFIGSASR